MRRSEPVINPSRLPRRYFTGKALCVQAHGFGERSEIGVHQEVVSSSPLHRSEISRIWVALWNQDREHQNREDNGTQHPRCKSLRIAIESSHHVIYTG